MSRYTVYHQANGRDGDAGYDDLTKADKEFDDQCTNRSVTMVELIDNDDPDNPVTLRSWTARDGQEE